MKAPRHPTDGPKRSPAQKRVSEAMRADRVWDKAHGVKQGSAQDKAIDAAVKRRAERSR